MKEEFITFDSFLVKKNEIIYAFIENNNSVKLVIRDGQNTKTLCMQYSSDYQAKQAMSRLSLDIDSYTIDHWKHSFVKQMYFTRENVQECLDAMKIVRKEVNSLRMELRRNRLKVKTPTPKDE